MNNVVHLHQLGETRKETVSQARWVFVLLSGGDEPAEPESPSQFPRGVLPVVGNQPTRQKLKGINSVLIKVLVIDKVSETFDTKKGSKTLHLLVCQDQSRPPLRNSFDYDMTAEELGKHGATLVDKQVELNVRDITQNFSGRIRMSGAITKVGA
jgi:hypothetical protein